MIKYDVNLMYTCSLIEYIGRNRKLTRSDVVDYLGTDNIKRIYSYADVLHCESIERVADEYINIANIPMGKFDNVSSCKYEVPDYWSIGEVYERHIEDVSENNVVDTLLHVYRSWISDSISNYNSDFFYQPRDYIKECYLEGEVIAD